MQERKITRTVLKANVLVRHTTTTLSAAHHLSVASVERRSTTTTLQHALAAQRVPRVMCNRR